MTDARQSARAVLLRAESNLRLARQVTRETRERLDSLTLSTDPPEQEILRAIAAVRSTQYRFDDVKLVFDLVEEYMQKKLAEREAHK